MAKKVTTLFIQDNNINLLVMKGRRVNKWASLPLEPGLVSQGLIQDEAQVASRVKELFKLAKVRAKKVVVGLSGLNSVYRIITLPELPETLLSEAVKHEASRAIPMSIDEVYLAYQPIPGMRGETRVFLAAFPRNMADSLIRTVRQADVEPYIMDLAPLALSRIPDEPRAIIINARLDYLNIMVIADRLPQVIRGLSLPSETESLPEKLPAITEEFSRTVTFYNSTHLEKPLDSSVPVFVCGDLAEAPDTWQSVVGRLGYSVSAMPSPVESPEGFNPNEFMVNIGLALKELLLEKEGANFSLINFNVLPEVYLPKAFPLARILVPAGIVVGVGILAWLGFFVRNTSAHTEELRSQLADTEFSIVQHNTEIAALKEQVPQVEAEIGPVEATADVFDATVISLQEGRTEVSGDLGQIVALAQSEIRLTGVKHQGNTVTVSGTAPNEVEVFGYARNLKNSGQFSVVIITDIKFMTQTIQEAVEEEEEEIEYTYTYIEWFNFEFQLTN